MQPRTDGAEPHEAYTLRQRIGLPLGGALFLLFVLLPTPDGLSEDAQRAGAVAILMATWWVSEALPLAATALLPLALFPVLSVASMSDTASDYASPIIFLFMGGFMIGLAMERSGLHRRVGMAVLRLTGRSPQRVLLGFMLATAFLSMWVSNTATAVMMLPIGTVVVAQALRGEAAPEKHLWLGPILMLGIAYAASIGGVATLIGTPPNAIFAGQSVTLFPELGPVRFLQWIVFGLPLAAGFLAIVWAYLSLLLRRAGVGELPPAPPGSLHLGPWSRAEKLVAAVFVLAALGWLGRGDIEVGGFTIPGWATVLGLEGVHDATVAIVAALVLFAVPLRRRPAEFALDWPTASRLPWHVLLLFGGGFALAGAFSATGLAEWLAGGLDALGGVPVWVLVLAVSLAVTFLTEVTSNTATATILLPIMAAAAAALDVHPYLLMLPVTVSASFAFMLPTATPPNAVVFGSEHVTIPTMARIGFALNVLGALWITLMTFVLAGPVFGFAV